MRSKPRPASAPATRSSSPITYLSLAIMGCVFIAGIALGVGLTSVASSSSENVASRDTIDRAAPSADVCLQYGASAVTMDTRIFLTLNPFNVYVSQPKMQPGCVLRTNNWDILEERKLVTHDQEQECKNRMNTFAFTGDLGDNPQLNCVYQNDEAENLFLNKPGFGPPPTGSETF